jgi:tripartite ATP-independent transporter DctM subunit
VKQRRLATAENLIVALALAAMVLLPLVEATLRKLLHTGISGSSSIVQHLTLIIGVMGGALAARENRLLTLSTMGKLLKGRWRESGEVFSAATGTAVCAYLSVAGVEFVLTEIGSGHTLVYGLPLWIVQALIPAGFAVIGARIVFHASASWTGRAIAATAAGAMALLCAQFALSTAALILLAVATLLGLPAFATMGGVALILFWKFGDPIASVAIEHYSLVINPVLPTMPLFTLAGYFLAEGGAPKRLVRVFAALFGSLRGGPAIVTAVACAFFTSFTGGSGVTILALGGLLMTVLRSQRYSERDALGLITGAGSLGLLFPPCLPLILYAIIANVEIRSMFLGGLLPGMVMLIATAGWGFFIQGRGTESRHAFDWKEAGTALWVAKWELLLPVVAVVALFGGFATPVEAAALTAFCAFVVETVIYRDLKLTRDVPRVMAECGLLIGGVLLIQGVALGFTNYLVTSEITMHAAEWTTSTIQSRWIFLLVLNLFLLVVGCLMEIYVAIIVQVPILVPIGKAYGIDPIHLGIIFLANLELGYLTPPVGLNLILSSYRFDKPLPEIMRSAVPMMLVLGVGVLLITYIPWLTTMLPRWLR